MCQCRDGNTTNVHARPSGIFSQHQQIPFPEAWYHWYDAWRRPCQQGIEGFGWLMCWLGGHGNTGEPVNPMDMENRIFCVYTVGCLKSDSCVDSNRLWTTIAIPQGAGLHVSWEATACHCVVGCCTGDGSCCFCSIHYLPVFPNRPNRDIFCRWTSAK